jgi:hypothetical protein
MNLRTFRSLDTETVVIPLEKFAEVFNLNRFVQQGFNLFVIPPILIAVSSVDGTAGLPMSEQLRVANEHTTGLGVTGLEYLSRGLDDKVIRFIVKV